MCLIIEIQKLKIKMKRNHCAVVLLLALVITSCDNRKNENFINSVRVKTTQVAIVATGGACPYSGTIEEVTSSSLSFAIPGTLDKLSVCEGQHVSQGQLLGVLNQSSVQSAYDAAVATLIQTNDAYVRMKQLHDNGSLPDIKWVEAESQLQQAQALERLNRKNLNNCKLYAPFDGVIAEKNAEVGYNVMPGVQVVRLVSVKQVKVKIAVPENEISSVKTGQRVQFRVAALDEKQFHGVVSEIGIVANSLSRSYDVKILVDNSNRELMPGMICSARFANESSVSGIIIPAETLQTDSQNKTFVWIYANGIAKRRIVECGGFTDLGVLISSGLKEGEEVILGGQHKVSEGMKIEKL